MSTKVKKNSVWMNDSGDLVIVTGVVLIVSTVWIDDGAKFLYWNKYRDQKLLEHDYPSYPVGYHWLTEELKRVG